MPPPSENILRQFGVAEQSPRPVEGGQGITFRAGELALKRCEDIEHVEWLSQVMEDVEEAGFRIARPVRSATGRFVVDGWCATRWIEGTTAIAGQWREAVGAVIAFHRAIAAVPWSPMIGCIDNPYVRADSDLWRDPPRVDPGLGELAERLRRRLRPVTVAAQLVHGDPSEGNLLFCPGKPVGIIDIAAYWHPANYALAMLFADGIAWSGAPVALLEDVKHLPEMDQLLARAVLFRLQVGMIFGGAEGAARRAEHYAPVVEAMERWPSN